jgi:hypothetical protein
MVRDLQQTGAGHYFPFGLSLSKAMLPSAKVRGFDKLSPNGGCSLQPLG